MNQIASTEYKSTEKIKPEVNIWYYYHDTTMHVIIEIFFWQVKQFLNESNIQKAP